VGHVHVTRDHKRLLALIGCPHMDVSTSNAGGQVQTAEPRPEAEVREVR
jgi:hypothetical protein